LDVIEDKVVAVIKKGDGFSVKTESGKGHETKTILVCSGGRYRHLEAPGEKEFIGKGVAFCATCDAPFFKGKDVAVIGAGNAGLESVLDLVPYANKIYLLAHRDTVKGDPLTYEKVKNCGKAETIFNAETKEILGDGALSGLKYKDTVTGEEKELSVQGVFVKIGTVPNSDIVKGLIETNEYGEIKTDIRTGRTSAKGIWAAGDVTDNLYKQNNIAAGDAVRATLDIYSFLQSGK
jgi:alkyl hydroperoxide reductase subunit F